MGQAHDRPWRQLACGKDAIISVLKKYGYIPCGSDLSNGYDFLADKFRWAPVIGLSGFTNRTYGISTSASGPAAGSRRRGLAAGRLANTTKSVPKRPPK
jgi:hypothetical protein